MAVSPSRATPPGGGPARRAAVLAGSLLLVAGLVLLAWWLRPPPATHAERLAAEPSRALAERGGAMDLTASEARASESLAAEVRAAAAAGTPQAEEEETSEPFAALAWRPEELHGRLVLLEGGALPEDVTVSLRRTHPRPRLHEVSTGLFEPIDPGFMGWDGWGDATLRVATRTSVGADGTFRITRVPNSECWIQVEHETLWTPEPARVPAQRIAPFDAAEDEDDASTPPALEVTVLATHGGVLAGRVSASDGAPLEKVKLSCAPPVDPWAVFEGPLQALDVEDETSGADGAFRFAPLPAGLALRLHAAPTDEHQGATLEVSPLQPREVRRVDLALLAGGVVTGTVLDEDDRPMASAKVQLAAADLDVMRADPRSRPSVLTNTADDEGRFRFAGLAAGRYRLVLAASDAIPQRGEPFAVESGALHEGFVLRARRGLAVTGRVTNAGGEAIPGAKVQGARPPSLTDVSANLDRPLRTWVPVDEEGRFVLAGFAPGKVRVHAQDAGHVSAHVDVTAGDSDVLVVLEESAALAGIAMNLDSGEPLTSYTLRAFAGDGTPGLGDLLTLESRILESPALLRVEHPEGRFRVEGLRPGGWSLLLTAPGHARVLRKGLSVSAGRTTSGVILMVPLEGRVTGTVVDGKTGAPLEGALVTTGGLDMMATFQEMFAGAAPRTRTDAEGRFLITGLPAEPVAVSARHEGYVDESSATVLPRAGATEDVGLLRLSTGAAVFGRLLDERGRPEPGVTVLVADVLGRSMKRGLSDAEGAWRVQGLAAGKYSVTRMDFAVDYASEDASQYMNTIVTREVTLVAGEERRVDLAGSEASGTRLQGTVRAADGPQSGVMVYAQREDQEDRQRFASTDAEGRYAFEDLPPGEYLLQVLVHIGSAATGQPSSAASEVVRVLDLPVQEHDLRLSSGTLDVRVEDEAGRGLDGVRVLLERTDEGRTASVMLARTGHRLAEIFTSEGGRARFSYLPTGTYAVVAGGRNLLGMGEAGWATRRVGDLRVTDGQAAASVTLVLRAGAGLEGRVSDARGRPLAGVPVWAHDDRAGRWLSLFSETYTDHAGVFHLDGLEPGSWTLAFGGTSHALLRRPGLRAVRGEVTEVEVVLREGVEVWLELGSWAPRDLVVSVSDAGGPVPVELVALETLLGGLAAGGRQRVGRLAPGRYEVTVFAGGRTVHAGSVVLPAGDESFTLALEEP